MVMRRTAGVAALAVLVLCAVASCGGSGKAVSDSPSHPAASGPRPLTMDEASRLAVSRFLNYQGTGVHFTTTLVGADTVTISGFVDYRQAMGYAETAGAMPGDVAAFEWTSSTIAAWNGLGANGDPPLPPPTATPQLAALNPPGSQFDTVLAALLSLGQDRPDNAQLLQQGGARWVRSDSLAGTAVDVIDGPAATSTAGPSSAPSSGASTAQGNSVQYWIDSRGHLLRLDIRLGGGTAVTTISLNQSGFKPFTRVPALPTT